jgi:cyclopropane-fatty-acyl-phospholipid synthase
MISLHVFSDCNARVPPGTMPSSDLLLHFLPPGFAVDRIWWVNGKHYERTLNEWLVQLDSRSSSARRILAEAYGEDKADEQLHNWRVFLMYCAETFGFSGGNEWGCTHLLFSKRSSTTFPVVPVASRL